MKRKTKLHHLLAGRDAWDRESRNDAADYLTGSCTARDVVRLCEAAGQPHQLKYTESGLDAAYSVLNLLDVVGPGQLLHAWDQVLTLRADDASSRRSRMAAPTDGPDADLRRLLRDCSAYEVAALILGHHVLAVATVDRQYRPDPPRGIGSTAGTASLFRSRTEDGLEWLAAADPGKLRRILDLLDHVDDDYIRNTSERLRQSLDGAHSIAR